MKVIKSTSKHRRVFRGLPERTNDADSPRGKGADPEHQSNGSTEKLSGRVDLPKLLIASRKLGVDGQPWLWRQVSGLRGFCTELVCWERHNPAAYPMDDVAVHVLPFDPAPYDGAKRWRYRLRNLAGRNFYAALGPEQRALQQLLSELEPDLLLCYFGDIAMRLLPVARATGVPVVAYLHGDFQFLYNRWHRWSLARTARYFDAIVTINQIERRWLLQRGVPEEKLYTIPCGAPTNIFRPRARQDDGPVRFVMVSRLSPEKGCEWSLRAFAKAALELPNAELHIYGDGPLREYLHRLARDLGMIQRVEFYGWVDENRLAEALPTYDVFVQHSLSLEGFGVSIVEASACELPLVVTPVGGIAEHVVAGETGLCVGEKDIGAMASAMVDLARSPDLRRRLGKAGRRRAVDSFDSTLQTRRLEHALLNVLARRAVSARSERIWQLGSVP